jgi:hypothetical protein
MLNYGQVMIKSTNVQSSNNIQNAVKKYFGEIDRELVVFNAQLCTLLEKQIIKCIETGKFTYLNDEVVASINLCILRRCGNAPNYYKLDAPNYYKLDASEVANLFARFPALYRFIKPLADKLYDDNIEHFVNKSIKPKIMEYFENKYDNNYIFKFEYRDSPLYNSIFENQVKRFILTANISNQEYIKPKIPISNNIPTSIPELQCDICHEYKKNVGLSCGHVYCSKCVDSLSTCPQCRKDITRTTYLYI